MADGSSGSTSGSNPRATAPASVPASAPPKEQEKKEATVPEDRIDHDRKANPQLERVLDEIQVVKDNIPVNEAGKLDSQLDSAVDAVRSAFVKTTKKDQKDQEELEEKLKKPQ